MVSFYTMNLSEIKPPLRFANGTESIWTKLAAIPRTGWVQWGIPHPETVAEHILATRELAVEWQAELGLGGVELAEVLAIIEVHDWPEVIVGDLVIMGDEKNAIELRRDKHQRERSAMIEICSKLPERDLVLSYYERYETGFDEMAALAKQLDKLQAVLLADQYQKQFDKPGLLEEFIHYTEPYLHHPFLLKRLLELKENV